MLMALTIGVGSSFAQNEQVPTTPTDAVVATGVVSTDAGLTPESPFYFLDRLGEFLREFFAFSPEAKVKLKIEFAKERIAEIKIMLKAEDTNTDDVDEAQSLLVEDMEDVQDISNEEEIDDESSLEFTTLLDDEIDDEDNDEDAKKTFKKVKDDLENHQKDIDDDEIDDNQKDVEVEDQEDIEDDKQETKIEDSEDTEDTEDSEDQNEREDD